MGFLDNTSITVDAILTKKGRELLARRQTEFKITKFALADDEVDYNLWDTTHTNGSNYYGAVIENMPILEAFVDENQLMRYKLTTLPKETAKLPILEVPNAQLTFNGAGQVQTISPNTRNGVDKSFTFVLQNSDLANISPEGGAFGSGGRGATTPVFLNEADRKRSLTITGKSIKLISRSATKETKTNVTVIGRDTGATFNIPVTVKADPSKL